MQRLRRIFVIIAIVLVVAPLVANAPLFDPDEGLHAAIAQEMVTRGDYVTPRFLGEPFLDKPILFFWAEAASLRVIGDREAAVRLPPLLFGVLGMVAVAALGAVLFGEAAGLLAGIVYGTMLVPLGVSEVAVHDVAVVPFMCAACVMLARERTTGTAKGGILAGIALGLSILTKGLVAVAFIGLLAICLGVRDRSRVLRLAIFLAIATVVAVLVALPWYLAMEHAHPGYLHYYFVERHLQGYLTATQRHAGRGWWYYLPIVAGGTVPWTAYLASAARVARASSTRLLVWAWFALGLVFLSAGESKLLTYALPLFPALAILAGERIASRGDFGGRAAFATFAATLAALPLIALAIVTGKFGPVGVAYWLVVAIVSAAIAVVAVAVRPGRWRTLTDAAAPTLLLPVMALVGLLIVAPRAGAWMSARDLAALLNAGGTLPPQVFVIDERVGSLIFYLSPALRAEVTPDRVREASVPETLSRVRLAPAETVVAVRDTQVPRFTRVFATPPAPDAHAGTFTIFRAATLQRALPPR